MSKRNEHARTAQSGASNPRPIAQSLVDAIGECYAEGVSPDKDSAVAMILHQLAFVLGQSLYMDHNEWQRHMNNIQEQS